MYISYMSGIHVFKKSRKKESSALNVRTKEQNQNHSTPKTYFANLTE